MSQPRSKDMIGGSEARHLIRFALPMLAGNLLQQLYNIVNTVIVGKFLGDDALAAVGATGSVLYLFYTLCLGLSVGSGIIIAQYFGAGQKDKMKSLIFNSAAVTAAFGIIVSVFSVLLTEPALRLLQTPEHLISTSAGYMKISCGGTLAIAAYNWINSVMRAIGDSRTPLVFLGIASVLNVLLDLLFVVVMDFGVNGAAAATVTAQSCAAASSIVYAFLKNRELKLKKHNMKIHGEMLLECIKTGLPIALQNAMISVSMVALQRVTNTFGETIMSAYTVSMRIEQLVQQPFSSLNAAVSTFTAQNTGAGKHERVVKGFKISLKIAAVFAVAVQVVFLAAGRQIVGCFVNGGEVIAIGAAAIQLTSCFYIFLGAIHTTRGFLNGAGDTGYAMINGFAEVICRIGLSLVLTSIPFIGYWGIWGTTCITWLATAAISLLRYRSGSWKTKSVIKAER